MYVMMHRIPWSLSQAGIKTLGPSFHIPMASRSPDPGLDAVLSILLSIREENELAREVTSVRS